MTKRLSKLISSALVLALGIGVFFGLSTSISAEGVIDSLIDKIEEETEEFSEDIDLKFTVDFDISNKDIEEEYKEIINNIVFSLDAFTQGDKGKGIFSIYNKTIPERPFSIIVSTIDDKVVVELPGILDKPLLADMSDMAESINMYQKPSFFRLSEDDIERVLEDVEKAGLRFAEKFSVKEDKDIIEIIEIIDKEYEAYTLSYFLEGEELKVALKTLIEDLRASGIDKFFTQTKDYIYNPDTESFDEVVVNPVENALTELETLINDGELDNVSVAFKEFLATDTEETIGVKVDITENDKNVSILTDLFFIEQDNNLRLDTAFTLQDSDGTAEVFNLELNTIDNDGVVEGSFASVFLDVALNGGFSNFKESAVLDNAFLGDVYLTIKTPTYDYERLDKDSEINVKLYDSISLNIVSHEEDDRIRYEIVYMGSEDEPESVDLVNILVEHASDEAKAFLAELPMFYYNLNSEEDITDTLSTEDVLQNFIDSLMTVFGGSGVQNYLEP